MCKAMLHRSLYSLIVLLCIGVLSLHPEPVFACSKPEEHQVADPWFIEHVIVDEQVINTDVQIKPTDGSFPITVFNHSDTFLYILMGNTWKTCDAPIPLPNNLGATEKISATHNFYCTYDGTLGRTLWRESPKQKGSVELAQYLLYQLAPDLPNMNRRADNRPPDVPIPHNQHGSMRVMYDDAIMSIPVTVTYSLNPNYDPYRYYDATHSPCGFGRAVYLLYALVIASTLGLFLGFWLLFKITKQPRLNNKT
ncbi:MAG TPA: hypothetical protein VGD58_04565 [Herpetosiphonaceae bacterium]